MTYIGVECTECLILLYGLLATRGVKNRPKNLDLCRPAMAPKRRYKQRAAKNGLRGGAKFDFMRAIAKKAALPAGSVQKLLAALKVMVIDQLQETGYCCIGGICRLRVKTKPAQKARTMICWGKKIRLKARDRPVKKISCVMLRPLSHALE